MTMLRTLVALLCLLPALALAGATDISREAFKARLAAGKPTVIVDVRTPEEFAGGHVPGAINMPLADLPARAAELAAHRADGSLVLYCRSGRRAAQAADLLSGQGFTGLLHLEGDIVGWIQAGEPVAP